MSIKFLVDGTAVEVVEKTSTGFIVKKLYQAGDEDQYEDEEQETGVIYGDPQIVREVFDTPPTAQKHAEIASLEKHIKELTERRDKLSSEASKLSSVKWELEREQKNYEKTLTVVQGRNIALARLGDFLDGKITHYVQVDYYRVQIVNIEDTKEDYGWPRQFRLLTLHGETGGDLSWKLGHYSSRDGGDYTVYPCMSLEEAQAVAKEKLTEMCSIDRLDEGGIGRIIECAKKIGFEVPQELVVKRDNLILERLERVKKNALDALEKTELEIAKFRKERANP